MNGVVLKGQSLATIAAMQAGSIEAFPQFLIENGFDLENDVPVGVSFTIPENAVYNPFRSVLETPLIQSEEGQYEHVVTYGQSIIDICSQVSGSLDSIVDMMVLNGLGQITDLPKAGAKLKVNRKSEARPNVVKYYSDRNMRVNNRSSYSKKEGGIGFMGIGIDFIVS